MASYDERRAAQQARLDGRIEQAQAEAARRFRAADSAVAGIEPGQPILVGHHSEGHHRAALARCDANMRAGLEALDSLKSMPAEATGAILASDDDATDQLAGRIAELEALQARMKAENAAARKVGKPGCEAWQLSNNSANIRRLKLRLAGLSAAKARPTTEREVAGVRVVEDTTAMRLRLIFPGRPAPEMIEVLKSRGFRWAPSEGAWQRQLNNTARWAAEVVLRLLASERKDA